MYQNIKKVCKELEKIFGVKATEKVWSHLTSLNERIKELEKSRNSWKRKHDKLKEKK